MQFKGQQNIAQRDINILVFEEEIANISNIH